MREFLEFVHSVFWHWQSWVGGSGAGGAIVVFLVLYEKFMDKKVSKQLYGLIVLVTFVIGASFVAWRDEYRGRVAAETKAGGAYLQCGMQDFYVTNGPPFPINRPLRIDIVCTDLGVARADNPVPQGEIFLLSDAEVPTQEKMINDWKHLSDEQLKVLTTKERRPIFPGLAVPFLAEGPVISADDYNKIITFKELVFVIGRVRFHDSNGMHEARACMFFNGFQRNGTFTKTGWTDCEDYVTQVNLH